MIFYIVPNTEKKDAISVTNQLVEILNNNGATCVLPQEMSRYSIENCRYVTKEQAIEQADIAVSIGGDGTILHTSYLLIGTDIPVIGINIGRLGFLTAIECEELEKIILITQGKYTIQKQHILEVNINGEIHFAINEMALCATRAMKTIRVNVKCDAVDVNSYRGDGVIVASPTGSTAYSLSAGGPIVDSSIKCMVVTPICAHSLNTPPIIFSETRKINIQVQETNNTQVDLVIDGKSHINITEQDEISVVLSEKFIPFIRLTNGQQFKAIDQKLKGSY